MGAAESLQRTVQSVQFTDSEIKRIATLASQEASSIMAGLEKDSLRRAQIALAKVNVEMWGNIGDATKVGMGDAVWNATEFQALYDQRLFEAAGIDHRYWQASMMQQAKQGIEAVISRKENGFTLSDKVYHNQALSKGYIDNAINNGLLLNKSVAEIKKDVIGFIDPNTPGGASFAAQRLARTEVVNAYHRTAVRKYQQTPWVEKVKWNLSGSHGRPDACNDYADSVHYMGKGWDAGEWRPGDVPEKPHPNCLCYVEPVTMSLDAYAKAFKAGKYDNYIDQQMGCFRVG